MDSTSLSTNAFILFQDPIQIATLYLEFWIF